MWLLCSLAAALTPGSIPLSGVLSGADGAPLSGSMNVQFRLYPDAATATPFWETDQVVEATGGRFAALLGSAEDPLYLESFTTWPSAHVSVAVAGVESARVAINHVPYAAWSFTAHQARGLDLTGNSAAQNNATRAALRALLDEVYTVTETQVEGWVTNAPLNLAAGSQMGGAGLLTTAMEATIEGYVTNAAINLAAGSQMGGAGLLTTAMETTIEGYITNGALDLNGGSTLGGATFGAVARSAVSGTAIDLNAGSTLGGATFGAVARSAVSGAAIDLHAASTLGGQSFAAASRSAVSGSAIDLNASSTLGGVPFGTAARTAVTGSALALHTGTTIAGQDVLNRDRLLAVLTTEVTGRFFRLYGDEVSGGANTTAVHPNINITGTTGNRVGSAIFQMVSSWHCDYCYSAGPKAFIRTAGNVPYSFCAVGDDIYMYTDTTHTHRFLSSAPISPVAVASLPAGCLSVSGI